MMDTSMTCNISTLSAAMAHDCRCEDCEESTGDLQYHCNTKDERPCGAHALPYRTYMSSNYML